VVPLRLKAEPGEPEAQGLSQLIRRAHQSLAQPFEGGLDLLDWKYGIYLRGEFTPRASGET
jgi:hypothetical protein